MPKEKNNRQKIKTAIALGYDPDKDNAPRVLASGKGCLLYTSDAADD